MKTKVAYGILFFGIGALIFFVYLHEDFEAARFEHKIDYLQYGASISKQRLTLLKKSCVKSKKNYNNKNIDIGVWLKKKPIDRPRVYYSETHKFMVCATPKCGTTQWRRLILMLDGLVDTVNADESPEAGFSIARAKRFIWNVFDTTKENGRKRLTRRFNEYYRIMTVREPLERLVSAYKDKLEGDRKRHRDMFGAISNKIHASSNNGTEGSATFPEFVRHILQMKNPTVLNPHWRPYTALCDPCRMNYDYIAKMETIYDDVTYLSEVLGIDRDKAFNDSYGAQLQEKWAEYKDYYSQLSPQERKAIYKYYKTEYDFFDYPFPSFIKP